MFQFDNARRRVATGDLAPEYQARCRRSAGAAGGAPHDERKDRCCHSRGRASYDGRLCRQRREALPQESQSQCASAFAIAMMHALGCQHAASSMIDVDKESPTAHLHLARGSTGGSVSFPPDHREGFCLDAALAEKRLDETTWGRQGG